MKEKVTVLISFPLLFCQSPASVGDEVYQEFRDGKRNEDGTFKILGNGIFVGILTQCCQLKLEEVTLEGVAFVTAQACFSYYLLLFSKESIQRRG